MEIILQYFDGCPNWEATDAHLNALLSDHDLDATLRYQPIDSLEAALEHHFKGSPTVLINGVDAFVDTDAPFGLSCRIYQTEDGPAGSPTLHQLLEAITTIRQGT